MYFAQTWHLEKSRQRDFGIHIDFRTWKIRESECVRERERERERERKRKREGESSNSQTLSVFLILNLVKIRERGSGKEGGRGERVREVHKL